MLAQHSSTPASPAELDLMGELNASCAALRNNIYRLVAAMDDKDDGMGEADAKGWLERDINLLNDYLIVYKYYFVRLQNQSVIK